MKKVLLIFFTILFCFCSIATAQDDNETCLSCHGEDPDLEGLNHAGEVISMFVVQASLDSSMHSSLSCVDCHNDLEGFNDYPHADDLKPVDCSNCHDDISKIFLSSAHGTAKDNPNAPACASCHGKHNILADEDPLAMTSKKQLPYTCSNCHHKQFLMADPDVKITDAFDRYMRGVHALSIKKGFESSASCSDCHGIHDLWRASDPRSKVYKRNIPKTCSKCHNDIYIKYNRGIHGKALAAGISDSPNCSDCHGEHEILKINDPTSPVNKSNLSDYVCGKCHNDPLLVEKYKLGGKRFSSYQDSYHGLAVKGGSIKAANCVSCHEAHDILPESNPASSIHVDNLVETCQKCHPKANMEFATSYSHNIKDEHFSALNRMIEMAYIILIILVIGGMLAHNGIILGRYILERYRERKNIKSIQRFTTGMVVQHMLVSISFIVLVITGFALKYNESWWATMLKYVGINEAARSVIHRTAAVIMIGVSIYHLVFLLFTKRGKYELKEMWFTKNDLTDPVKNIKFHLGLSNNKPKYDRYDYTEKAEYWALVWGTIVMVGTGFVLWFPTFFTGFLPSWIVKVAEIIHLYEAWLATLAIIVFHFFFVIFHPEQYPLSFTMINGKMSEEEVKHHHPGWYRQIKEDENKKSNSSNQKNEEKISLKE